MKKLHTENISTTRGSSHSSSPSGESVQGFPRVVVDGSFVRVDKTKPFMARMVSSDSFLTSPTDEHSDSKHTLAVLESVSCNLEAGMEMLDSQENSLAKIGGRLAGIALALNNSRSPEISEQKVIEAQLDLESAQRMIRQISKSSYKQVALFSNGASAPIAIAVPVLSRWEGLSIERCNISTPGLKTVDEGKIHGSKAGFFLDHATVKRAFTEWRKLCCNNRMQWSMLKDRIYSIKSSIEKWNHGTHWRISLPQNDSPTGPLDRPNRNN
jgi:hypothetical protein